MAMGSDGPKHGSAVEDPNQPDWMKHKALREVETIRESKKSLILDRLFN
jgi:hypothetical protein